MLLKREMGPNSWVIGAVVEAICRGRGSGSLGRDRSFGIGHELATILLHSSHDYRRNRPRSTTIGRRSCLDPQEDADR